MLIGGPSNKPSIKDVRRIKLALENVLDLSEDGLITVSQLACLEEDCAPLETVIGVLVPGAPQRQHKVHKAVHAIVAQDLVQVCDAFGKTADVSDFETFFKES